MARDDKFAFVMNVASLEADNYELTPGYVLRRATHEEIELIKNKLEGLTILLPTPLIPVLWEGTLPLQPPIETLPETEWRYHVIAFRDHNEPVEDIQTASDLARIGFEIGFTIPSKGAFISRPMRLFHVLHNAGWFLNTFPLHRISETEVTEIMAIYSHFRATDVRLIPYKRLAVQLNHLKSLPHGSPLRFLGYFGILEAVLTHAPKPNDPYDSITRQVRKKIALLNNRWSHPIDYSAFGGAKPETVWEKMYGYRSRIAHGGNPDPMGKDFAIWEAIIKHCGY